MGPYREMFVLTSKVYEGRPMCFESSNKCFPYGPSTLNHIGYSGVTKCEKFQSRQKSQEIVNLKFASRFAMKLLLLL